MSFSIAGPVTVLSSTVLRLATYVFLRWVRLLYCLVSGVLANDTDFRFLAMFVALHSMVLVRY